MIRGARSEWARDVLDALPLQIATIAADGTVDGMNAAWKRWMIRRGLEPDGLEGASSARLVDALRLLCAGCARDLEGAIAGVRAGARASTFPSSRSRFHPHCDFTLDVAVLPTSGGLVVSRRDVGAQKRRERELEYLAHNDDLTGLARRASFLERATRMLTLAQRRGRTLHVLYLDLDDFKGVNDRFGHEVGDYLLVRVAQRFREHGRKGDLHGRLGGDEFGVIAAAEVSAETIGRRYLEVFSEPFLVQGRARRIGVSVGVATHPHHGGDIRTLLRSTDAAMYAAKRARSGVHVDPHPDPHRDPSSAP